MTLPKRPFAQFKTDSAVPHGVIKVPALCVIGLAADWGTGTDSAYRVGDLIASSDPDFTIHLGDVYYSGTGEEYAEYFLAQNAWPRGKIATFALNANHEMYSGGEGYFDHVLAALKQETSYFCLENEHWRLLALDPQIEVTSPDGFVYQNLKATDRQPSVDLNATLSGAVLPLTGAYYLRAATLKGFGDYRLTFSYVSVAAVPAAQRVVPFAGSVNTVPLNAIVSPQVAMLDPRGYTTSGALVQFSTANGPDDHATISFTNTYGVTSTDGIVSVNARPTTIGKAQLTATYSSTVLGSFVLENHLQGEQEVVPRYSPVAISQMLGLGLDAEGNLVTQRGRYENLPVWTPAAPVEIRQAPSTDKSSKRSAGAGLAVASAKPVLHTEVSPQEGVPAAAVPQAPRPLSLTTIETITDCSPAPLTIAGVNWATVNWPFTVTLTDETPSTGQSQPNGVVDVAGIRGHRVQKTIRMHIDIKDSLGSTPSYPVLVRLSVEGPAHGILILDPDGNRVQCSSGTFLWHERDAQGNIIALNEEFEYKLGTYAPYVGAIPDTQNPSVLKPVWGTAEVLDLVVSSVDSSGQNQRQKLSYNVHPEPAKPTAFAVSVPPPPNGTPAPIWEYWSDWKVAGPITVNGRSGNGVVSWNYNHYYLLDPFNNITFGYTSPAQPPAPGQTIALSFFDQTSGSSQFPGVTADPVGYGWQISWNDNPAMPSGPYSSTLTLNYPADPDWSAGSVSQPVSFQFDRGTLHFLAAINGWDIASPDGSAPPPSAPVEYDPPPPWTVSPGAFDEGLPHAMSSGDPSVAQTMKDVARMAFLIGTGPSVAGPPNAVFVNGTHVETSDTPSFRVSLVDAKGQVATDGQFQVDLCPRWDHFSVTFNVLRLCTLSPVRSPAPGQSLAGVVQSVAVNSGSGGDNQGYVGIELIQAPKNPGTYYIKFEALAGNANSYRIREQSDIFWDNSLAGEGAGAWALVTVAGGEFLDENFHLFPDGVIKVTQPITVYLRYFNPSAAGPSTASLTSTFQNGPVLQTGISVVLSRQALTQVYIGSFTAVPERDTSYIPPGQPSIQIPLGSGVLTAVEATAAPLGIHALDAQSSVGILLATNSTAFPGILRMRFLKRDAPPACDINPSAACLTLPDQIDPQFKTVQETKIDTARNYAEVVRIFIDAVNPKDTTETEQISEDLYISEIPNLAYQDDGLYRRRLFYDGRYQSTALVNGNVDGARVTLRNGQAVITLYSVGEAKHDSQTHDVLKTDPYVATLSAASSAVGPSGPILPAFPATGSQTVNQWVDEGVYQRTRVQKDKTWLYTAPPSSVKCPDWLEMKTMDYCANVNASAGSEIDIAFNQVSSTRENWTAASDETVAFVDPSAPTVIQWKPEPPTLRFDNSQAQQNLYWGLYDDHSAAKDFGCTVSHETRHCWQNEGTSLTPPLIDADLDGVFANPPVGSEELLDAAYIGRVGQGQPGNPEADFQGDAPGNADVGPAVRGVRERNAIRFAGLVEQTAVACGFFSSSVTYSASTFTLTANFNVDFPPGSGLQAVPGPPAVKGGLVKVERALPGTGCGAATGWTLVGYFTTDVNGQLQMIGLASGVIRLTLITPKECPGVLSPSCVSIP